MTDPNINKEVGKDQSARNGAPAPGQAQVPVQKRDLIIKIPGSAAKNNINNVALNPLPNTPSNGIEVVKHTTDIPLSVL